MTDAIAMASSSDSGVPPIALFLRSLLKSLISQEQEMRIIGTL